MIRKFGWLLIVWALTASPALQAQEKSSPEKVHIAIDTSSIAFLVPLIDKDVKILAIGEEKLMYDTFKMGRVDAIVVAPPFSVQAKREGFPILAQTADHVVIPFSGLGTTIDRIKNNRAQVKKLLKAEIEALRLIQSNPIVVTEVIRKRFNMDEKLARDSYDAVANSFSRDGRVPLDGVDILLQIEKDAKTIPTTITPQMIVDASLAEEALKELGGK